MVSFVYEELPFSSFEQLQTHIDNLFLFLYAPINLFNDMTYENVEILSNLEPSPSPEYVLYESLTEYEAGGFDILNTKYEIGGNDVIIHTEHATPTLNTIHPFNETKPILQFATHYNAHLDFCSFFILLLFFTTFSFSICMYKKKHTTKDNNDNYIVKPIVVEV